MPAPIGSFQSINHCDNKATLQSRVSDRLTIVHYSLGCNDPLPTRLQLAGNRMHNRQQILEGNYRVPTYTTPAQILLE